MAYEYVVPEAQRAQVATFVAQPAIQAVVTRTRGAYAQARAFVTDPENQETAGAIVRHTATSLQERVIDPITAIVTDPANHETAMEVAGTATAAATNYAQETVTPVVQAATEVVRAHQRGETVVVAGQRIASDNSVNFSAPLTRRGDNAGVDRTLSRIKTEHPADVVGKLPDGFSLDATRERPPLSPAEQEAFRHSQDLSNQEMKLLSTNIARVAPLQFFMGLFNVQETDPNALVEMVQQMSSKHKSPLTIFLRRYKSQLSIWKRLFAYLICYPLDWLLSSRIIPRTVDAYMKQIFSEMRKNLGGGKWAENGQLNDALIRDLIELIEKYRAVTLEFAHDTSSNAPSLDARRKEAMEKLFDEKMSKVYKQFSRTLLTHLAPKEVHYFAPTQQPFIGSIRRWCNKVIHSVVRFFLRVKVLPNALAAISSQAESAVKPYNRPFAHAVTQALAEQTEAMLVKIDQEALEPKPTPIPGTEHLPELVRALQGAVVLRGVSRAELLSQEREAGARSDFDREVSDGICDSVVSSVHMLAAYLIDPVANETIFSNMLNLLNRPFTATSSVSEAEYANVQEELERNMNQVGAALARRAVEEKVEAGARGPVVAATNRVMDQRKGKLRKTAIALQELATSMRDTVNNQTPESAESVLRMVHSMALVCDVCSTHMQTSSDMAHLPPADQIAIQKPLRPVYESLVLVTRDMQEIDQIQIAQRKRRDERHLWEAIRRIIAMPLQTPQTSEAAATFAILRSKLTELTVKLGVHHDDVAQMRACIEEIEQTVNGLQNIEKLIQTRKQIWIEIQKIRFAIREQQPSARRRAVAAVRNLLAAIPGSPEKEQLERLIQQANQTHDVDDAWSAIKAHLQGGLSRDRATSNQIIREEYTPRLQAAFARVNEKIEVLSAQEADNLTEISRGADHLLEHIADFRAAAEEAQCEAQYHCSGAHGGVIAAAAMGAGYMLGGPAAVTGLAGAAQALARSPDALAQRDLRTVATNMGAGAAAGVALSRTLSTIPGLSTVAAIPAAIVGISAASQVSSQVLGAGTERVTTQIIDFSNGCKSFALSGHVVPWGIKAVLRRLVLSYNGEVR
jgi:hypothetical protein